MKRSSDYVLEITYSTDPALDDLVQSRLFLTASRGSSSIETGETTTVSAYFQTRAEGEAARSALAGLDVRTALLERERRDWLELYEQSLQPVAIGERFLIVPAHTLIPKKTDRLTLVIPQEQAFGTGSHESTALCLEMLERMDLGGKRGLDIGSGSGILALGMLRLGAQKVIAFDNDLDAYAALRQNRSRNGIDETTMPVFIGTLDALRDAPFDVITMNILPEVIVSLLPDVVRRLSVGATLIVSGVLADRKDEVLEAALGNDLTLSEEATRGEWWCAAFHRAR